MGGEGSNPFTLLAQTSPDGLGIWTGDPAVMRPVLLWSCPGVECITATVETDQAARIPFKEKRRLALTTIWGRHTGLQKLKPLTFWYSVFYCLPFCSFEYSPHHQILTTLCDYDSLWTYTKAANNELVHRRQIICCRFTDSMAPSIVHLKNTTNNIIG